MAENIFMKALNELSQGDIRSQIMTELSKTMTADEFNYVYLSSWSVYDTYFVYENYEGDCYVNYKVPYIKTETEITIDLANKVKVNRDEIWVEVSVMETSLNTLKEEITTKDGTITSLNATIGTLNTEKEEVSNKLTESTNSIADLSKQINEMKPIVETYNKDLYEKLLNQQKTKYEEKFVALNAKEKFESKEVQDLIIKSLNENEVKEAILSLNSMLVDLVKPAKSEVKPVITEPTKSLNN